MKKTIFALALTVLIVNACGGGGGDGGSQPDPRVVNPAVVGPVVDPTQPPDPKKPDPKKPDPPSSITCWDDTDCSPFAPTVDRCVYPEGQCGGPGTCQNTMADVCDSRGMNSGPVCGCDGVTYDSSCDAHVNGVNGIEHRGPCACDNNSECPSDQYCSLQNRSSSPDVACNDLGQGGTCVSRPAVCAQVVDPVCGCDGNTYNNSCEAALNGISVRSQGACR